jgi:hypothetical protein
VKKLIISITLSLMLVAVLAAPAIAAEEEASTSATVTVSEYVNITLSGSIDFGSVEPSDSVTYEATGQSDGDPAITITVESDTNVNVDIGIKGSVTGALALSNWQYSTTHTGTKTAIPASYGTAVYTDQGVGSYAFYHWVNVPLGTPSGAQGCNIYYKAIDTGGTF